MAKNDRHTKEKVCVHGAMKDRAFIYIKYKFLKGALYYITILIYNLKMRSIDMQKQCFYVFVKIRLY